MGSSFTRDEALGGPGFAVEYGGVEEDPVVAGSSMDIDSSSFSQILAVSSKLMTTELPLNPATKQKRSLQGRAASTEPGLIRFKKDPDGVDTMTEELEPPVITGYEDLNG